MTASFQSSDRTRGRAPRRGAVLALLALLLGSPALAAPMSFSRVLSFDSGNDSLWGPGGSGAAFDASGSASVPLFGQDVGGAYDISASSGSARARIGGSFTASYDDELARRGTSRIELGFEGTSGRFNSSVGASVDVTGFIHDVPGFGAWDPCVYCESWELDTDIRFSPSFGTQRTATDTFTVAGVGPSLPGLFGSTLASLELNMNASQSSRFTPDALTGTMLYRHRDTGTTRALPFSLTDVSFLDAELDLAGAWDFSFTELDIANSLSTTIGAGLSLDAFVALLLDESISLGNVPLLNTGSYSLSFARQSLTQAFTVMVPEPGTSLLLVAGLAGLVAFGRPRRMGAAR